jgi:hypothetical protein
MFRSQKCLVVSGDRVWLWPLMEIAIVSGVLSWKSYFTLSLIVLCDKVLLRDMELRHLRYFTAVAKNLNFSEASRRIHVAQPASGCAERCLSPLD